MAKKSSSSGAASHGGSSGVIQDTVIKDELESRFLSYALSTIVSRALPDARDGLKPVHRRVLYAMNQLRLGADARFRKSAAVVGDVIGKYHPHGDQAVYDTMVRLAQDFSLRYPLVEGQGNFGNIDGDSPAAMRYTEARLSKIAEELLDDLKKETVDFVPTYDETNIEPRLMPARFPNLLVNGSSGIAVGLATNIPPHNLTETINALVAMIDNPNLEVKDLLKYIKGPDFPTGAQILASRAEIKEVYETGKGSIKVRGEWKVEELQRGKWSIVITSIPYSVNKSRLIEKIADLIVSKKLPAIVDIRDESTEDIRVVLEPKSQTVEADKVMSYVFKHSDLQISFPVNMTALTPEAVPVRHSLKELLKTFLNFRHQTIDKRLRYELRIIKERLHILLALAKVYDDLDGAIAIIRKSKTRDEARQGLMTRFTLDELQANAILDLRLSALVTLEISKIKKEKAEKEAERNEIESILGSQDRLWKLVRKELIEIKDKYGDARRTKIITSTTDEVEFDPEHFIEHEDTHVIVSKNGWLKRMKSVTNPESIRFKDGDGLLAWLPLNTRDLVCFFTSTGKVYATRALEIQQTAGFGDPVQSFFKFGDGERLVSVLGIVRDGKETSPEHAPDGSASKPVQRDLFDMLKKEDVGRIYGEIIGQGVEMLFVTETGMGFRFAGDSLTETNRNGRKVANLKDDDDVLGIYVVRNPLLFILANDGHGLLIKIDDIPVLSGAGAGVRLMKIKSGAYVSGVKNIRPNENIVLTYHNGKDDVIKISEIEIGSRSTVGKKIASPRKKLIGLRKVN